MFSAALRRPRRLAPLFLLFWTLLGAAPARAQEAASGPSSPPPEQPGQLDFWLGEWRVSWEDAEGDTHTGTNTIRRILDGKVIEETFDASEAMGFRGTSFSVFDRHAGKWKQTWVDNSGNYMDFIGRADGDTFIFERRWTRSDGVEVENRMVFREIADDSLVWDWEGRPAGEAEWKLLWRLHYDRIGSP